MDNVTYQAEIIPNMSRRSKRQLQILNQIFQVYICQSKTTQFKGLETYMRIHLPFVQKFLVKFYKGFE